MAKTLIIVESPAKAKTIARYLGVGYSVTASMGHVRDLPQKSLGVEVADGSFEPQYEISPGKNKTISQIKQMAKDADGVLLATDPDREGEAIAWHIVKAASLSRKVLGRVEFHEITERAVKLAISNPRQIDMNLVDAQQARRVLDRLVGYKLSPLLWKKVQKGTSAGRVQSVALRIVVEREREIEAFVPREFWTVEADLAKSPFSGRKADIFHAALWNAKDNKKAEWEKGEQAQQIVTDLEGAKWQIAKITKKETQRRPSPPFTTSTLQQEASRKLKMAAQQTMKVAQELYEGVGLGSGGATGLITYMRTDSTQVATEAQKAAREAILTLYGADYLPDKSPFYSSKAKNAQEAHEAIRPTRPQRTPDEVKPYLSPMQYRLYRLIWQRFIASQMAPARIELTTIDIEAKGQSQSYPFRASGERILFPGFLAVYREGQGDTDEEEEAEEAGGLPALAQGDPLDLLKLLPEQHFTEPPPRYGEASLVKELERLGVGRPSTYATILSTLRQRLYVEEQKQGRDRKFIPTALGRAVNDLLVARFPELLDVQFTARLEEELDEVAEGKRPWTPLVASIYNPMMEQLHRAEREVSHVTLPDLPATSDDSSGGGSPARKSSGYRRGAAGSSRSPKSGSSYSQSTTGGGSSSRTRRAAPPAVAGDMSEAPARPARRRVAATSPQINPDTGEVLTPVRRERAPRAASSTTKTTSASTARRTQAAASLRSVTADPNSPACPLCGSGMVKRRGFSEFWGCSKYPGCKGTRKIEG